MLRVEFKKHSNFLQKTKLLIYEPLTQNEADALEVLLENVGVRHDLVLDFGARLGALSLLQLLDFCRLRPPFIVKTTSLFMMRLNRASASHRNRSSWIFSKMNFIFSKMTTSSLIFSKSISLSDNLAVPSI